MIISRTPYRISFFGGGTDYPGWYRENGGNVLSTTINKYSYISCKKIPLIFNYKYRLRYFTTEEIQKINEIKHPSFRETLKFFDINDPLELVHTGDLPAGTGLGASSAFTIGLVNTLHALNGEIVNKRQSALEALKIEQDIIGEYVGSQDQVACSFGGLNKITFGGINEFLVSPLPISQNILANLENHLVLLFTGFSRDSNVIIKDQVKNLKKNRSCLEELDRQVVIAQNLLLNNNIEDFGKLLAEQWKIKKQLSDLISTEFIDQLYVKGMNVGAYGGKILGAGSGGFILFIVKPDLRKKFISAMNDLVHIPIRIDSLGSQIVYYTN